MKEIRTGYKVSRDKWTNQGQFAYQESPNRKATDVVIGTKRYGDIREKILEPFYLDILDKVFEKKLKVYVDLYSEPSVVVELNGKLVLHNGDILSIKEDVEALLVEVLESNQIRALTEIRTNEYRENKVGPTTKAIRNVISQDFNRKINYHFLRLILTEKYISKIAPPSNDLDQIMRRYSKSQLVEIYGGIIEFEQTKGCKFGPMSELVQTYTPSDIQKSLLKELGRRFYDGDIK